MNSEIAKLLAERHFKIDDINDWAIKCLEKGYDSKSLRILASMSKWDSDSELDNYFRRSLKELGWDKIKQEDYLRRYAEILASNVIESNADPIKTFRQIYQLLEDADYPAAFYGCYEIDEMIWDYEYFLETGKKGFWYRSREELISEIKIFFEKVITSKSI